VGERVDLGAKLHWGASEPASAYFSVVDRSRLYGISGHALAADVGVSWIGRRKDRMFSNTGCCCRLNCDYVYHSTIHYRTDQKARVLRCSFLPVKQGFSLTNCYWLSYSLAVSR
jgi:hypothetical protein